MSVLHDTVPDYEVADKLKVELTTASETRRLEDFWLRSFLHGGSWRLFTQLSPFHGGLPRMDRPKYGSGELRPKLAAGLHT